MAFEDINHLLKAMLHTTRLAGFRDVDQENRCIVAASVQMYQGAVGFREIPAARFQSQEIEAEALVDGDSLGFCPIAVWVQQNLVAPALAAHVARAPAGHVILRLRSLSSPVLLVVSRRPRLAFFRLLRRALDRRQASFVLPRA